jgi:hypothetical protein
MSSLAATIRRYVEPVRVGTRNVRQSGLLEVVKPSEIEQPVADFGDLGFGAGLKACRVEAVLLTFPALPCPALPGGEHIARVAMLGTHGAASPPGQSMPDGSAKAQPGAVFLEAATMDERIGRMIVNVIELDSQNALAANPPLSAQVVRYQYATIV